MKILTKKLSLIFLGFIALCCFTLGALCFKPLSVQAENGETAPAFNPQTSMEMLPGANLRIDSTDPSLKFTAEISDYSAEYQYGMLIIPADWIVYYGLENNYIALLNATVGEDGYKNVLCTPYQDVEEKGTPENPGAWRISSNITESAGGDYSLECLAIGYVTDGASYKYASFDVDTNARSFSYVAQMAISHGNLTADEKASLENYVNYEAADATLNAIDYIVYSAESGAYDNTQITATGSAAVQTGEDKVMAVDTNAIGADVGCLSLMTKKYYFDVTEVSFKAKFNASWNDAQWENHPGGVGYGWWGINYFDEYSQTDIYTNMKTVGNRSTANNGWETITFTFDTPFDGYLSIIASVGEFAEPLMLIDDFTILSEGTVYTENFNDVAAFENGNGMFLDMDTREDVDSVRLISKEEPGMVIGSAPEFNSMTIPTAIESLSQIKSAEAYSNITSISFDVCISEDFISGWGGFQMGYPEGNLDVYEAGKVYEHLGVQNKFTFEGGYFDFMQTLNKGETYQATITVDGADVTASFLSQSGDAKGATCHLTTTQDLYLAFYHECKANGSYTISNFEVTANGKTTRGISNVLAGGADVVVVRSENEAYKFNNLVNANLSAYFANGNYAAIQGATLSMASLDALPETAVALTANIAYKLVGEKEFAILLSGDNVSAEYFYINNSSIAFYKNATQVSPAIALTEGENALTFSVTKAGDLFLSVNGSDNVYVGMVGGLASLKVVGMGGSGSLAIKELNAYTYAAEAKGASAKTFNYATYTPDGTYEGLTVVGETAKYLPSDGIATIDLSIAVARDDGAIAFATSEKHNFQSVSFDMYMPTFAAKTAWLGGFAFKNSIGDNYTGDLDGLGMLTKGAWNHVEFTISGLTATMKVGDATRQFAVESDNTYFYICINPGGGDWTSEDIIMLNNFTVVDANGTVVDTFDDATATLITASSSRVDSFGFKTPETTLVLGSTANAMLGVIGSAVGAYEVVALQTKDMYSNISYLSFDAKFDSTVGLTDRWGLGFSDSKNNYNYYVPTSPQFPMDNTWHKYEIVFGDNASELFKDGVSMGMMPVTDTGTYNIYLQICPKGGSVAANGTGIDVDEVLVYMDNFSITAGGVTYTDNFSAGASAGLFDCATGRKGLATVREEAGNGNDITTVASIVHSLDSYICGAAFETEGLKDAKKVLSGSISYEIKDGKEFVILLGEASNTADFLYVTANTISFCKVVDGEMEIVKTVSTSATQTIQITMLKSGVLLVDVGASQVTMGVVSNMSQLKIADVNAMGSVTFNEVKLYTQKYV